MTGVLYATLFELKQALSITDQASDVDLERALEAASRYVDGFCGRSFSLATAQTRDYYPEDVYRVLTTDLVTPTSVAVDSAGDRTFATIIPSTDYQLWPLNEGRYQEIHLWPGSADVFLPGVLVRVVGAFGCVVDGGPPIEVRQSVLILGARYFKRTLEAPFGVLQNTDLGQFTRLSALDPDVAALLAPWNLNRSWAMV